jgi:hypothetical protein
LGFGGENNEEVSDVETPVEASEEAPVEVQEEAPVETTPMPQSWAKDTQELWAKTPPEVQKQILHREKQMLSGLEQYKEHNEFGRKIKEIATPYESYLHSQGVDAAKAFQYLMSAQYKLSNGDQNTKVQMLRDIARGVGVDLAQVVGQPSNELEPLRYELNNIKQQLNARNEADVNQTRQRISQDVDQAYEKAVWANPVTRAKEIARVQTEHEAKLKAGSKGQVQKATQAKSSNVRSRDTGRTPTVPLGTMEDTMREVLAAQKARTH